MQACIVWGPLVSLPLKLFLKVNYRVQEGCLKTTKVACAQKWTPLQRNLNL
jgi:hypothetical protein